MFSNNIHVKIENLELFAVYIMKVSLVLITNSFLKKEVEEEEEKKKKLFTWY